MSFENSSQNFRDGINCDHFRRIFLLIILNIFLLLPSEVEAQLIESHNQTVKTSGDILLFTLPTSAAITTLILKDKKGTWQMVEGFATNLALTTALKYGINKRRPFNGGGQAFPSGHTSVTFQAASFIHMRYGFKYSIPAYLLAGWTAYSRINATRHDGYDILAGAVVGIGSSFIFTSPYQQEHMQLTFSGDRDQYQLGFVFKF